jgi:hypothetical protein
MYSSIHAHAVRKLYMFASIFVKRAFAASPTLFRMGLWEWVTHLVVGEAVEGDDTTSLQAALSLWRISCCLPIGPRKHICSYAYHILHSPRIYLVSSPLHPSRGVTAFIFQRGRDKAATY